MKIEIYFLGTITIDPTLLFLIVCVILGFFVIRWTLDYNRAVLELKAHQGQRIY